MNSTKRLVSVGEAEVRYRAKVLEVVEQQLTFDTGHVTTHTTVRHPGAVVILPRCDDGSLLLVRQYRHALGRTLLEFPAGTLERGEEPLRCAQREIIEETKHRAEHWQPLGQLFPAPGFCDEAQHLFFASGLSPANGDEDDDEILSVVTMQPAELEAAIRCGELCDAKSIAIYLRAKLSGLL